MSTIAYGSGFTSFSTMAPETAPAAEKVRRHPKYYLNGGDTFFLVENYIFRVHRYFFERESAIFREKLNIPPAPGQNPRGTSDSNPISLDDVREEDFSRFLWVFYNPKYSIYDANLEEWTSILKLSYEWKFPEVKRLSLRYLEKFEIDPIRKIELYQLHEIDRRLLIPSYVAVVNRQEPLSIQEGRRLTLETALLIATARECARGRPIDSGKHSPTVASVNTESMIEIIKEVFGLGQTTPSSPSLEPIFEGSGPSAFAATPMSPSKIVTSPPRDQPPREGVMSPTPRSKKKLHPEAITVQPDALLPGQSPTKPSTPAVPPYLAHMFTPPTPPETVKLSKSASKEATGPTAPAETSASNPFASTTSLNTGQSVTPRRKASLQLPQPTPLPLPPLQIPGNRETPTRKAQARATSSPTIQQPPTSSRKTKQTAPDPPRPAQKQSVMASALNLLRGSAKAPKAEAEDDASQVRTRKDSRDKRDSPASSGYHMNIITNTASGAGTAGHEWNDSKSMKDVQMDSVSSPAPMQKQKSAAKDVPVSAPGKFDVVSTRPMSLTAKKADSIETSSNITRASSDRIDPKKTETTSSLAPTSSVPVGQNGEPSDSTIITAQLSGDPKPESPSQPPASNAVSESDSTAITGQEALALEVPSVDVQPATPELDVADPLSDPADASSASPEVKKEDKTVDESTAQPAEVSSGDAAQVAASTTETSVAEPAKSEAANTPAPGPASQIDVASQSIAESADSSAPQGAENPDSVVAVDNTSDLNEEPTLIEKPCQDEGKTDVSEASQPAAVSEPEVRGSDELFKDAVIVQAPTGSDSEDDNIPLAKLKLVSPSQLAESTSANAIIPPSGAELVLASAGSSATGKPEATTDKEEVPAGTAQSAKLATEDKESKGKNKEQAEPTSSQEPKSSVEAPPSTEPNNGPVAATTPPPDRSNVNEGEAAKPSEAKIELTSENKDAAQTVDAPKGDDIPAAGGAIDDKAETQDNSKTKKGKKNKKASSSGNKPELHLETGAGGAAQTSEATPKDSAVGGTPDDEGGAVGSSIPKRLQDEEGAATTESETTSRPSSPAVSKNTAKRLKKKAAAQAKKTPP